MLAEKKTLPFWRARRPNFLELERALAAEGGSRQERLTDAERTVIEHKITQQRFEVAKGRVHAPGGAVPHEPAKRH